MSLEKSSTSSSLDPTQQKLGGALFNLEEVFEVDDYLYFYSESLTAERTDTEVSALVRYLGLETPMHILDLACGFGRHTNRLAALGHYMTGIDLMPRFLQIAREDADSRGVQVHYHQGDMRNIDFEEEFDRVILGFTAFGYFEDDENLLVLKNIARALKPGGRMIFDTIARDTVLKRLISHYVTEKEGNLMIDRVSFDVLTGRQHNNRIVIRDGVRKDKPFSIRLYNVNELLVLLKNAGLELAKLYGGWDDQPFTSESFRIIVLAGKPDGFNLAGTVKESLL